GEHGLSADRRSHRDGLPSVCERLIKLMPPERCEAHHHQGGALSTPISNLAGEVEEALAFCPGALKVAHQQAEVRLCLENLHQSRDGSSPAKLAGSLFSAVIEGNSFTGGKGLRRFPGCLEEICQRPGPVQRPGKMIGQYFLMFSQ